METSPTSPHSLPLGGASVSPVIQQGVVVPWREVTLGWKYVTAFHLS